MRKITLREFLHIQQALTDEVEMTAENFNKLFQSTIVNPTKEEIAAGIERLRFGPFGMVDWFAQRMHIADHDQVMALPWLRLYECARIDARRAEYERRLRDIYQQKNKL